MYENILKAIDSAKIPNDKKEYLRKTLNDFKNSKLSDAQKENKYKFVTSALLSYVDEAEANKLSTILKGTVSGTVKDIVKPFRGAWDSLNFLTKPPVLITILVLVALGFVYIRYIRKG